MSEIFSVKCKGGTRLDIFEINSSPPGLAFEIDGKIDQVVFLSPANSLKMVNAILDWHKRKVRNVFNEILAAGLSFKSESGVVGFVFYIYDPRGVFPEKAIFTAAGTHSECQKQLEEWWDKVKA